MWIKLFKTILLVMLFNHAGYAQFSRYIVQLKDKAGSPFTLSNPSQFLSARSLDRRRRFSIPIDSADLPVNQSYIDSILMAGDVRLLNSSKWFNQVCIQTSDAAALTKINALTFVVKSAPIAARQSAAFKPVNKKLDPPVANAIPVSPRPVSPAGNYFDYGLSYPQIHLHNTEFLHNHGFRGQGMQMAITDAGFYNYPVLSCFDSINNHHQVLGTWDFVSIKNSVSEENEHGTKCLSTIAANVRGSFVGTAPETSFYLYRTEDVSSEYPVEEQNWVAAAELADSSGTDILSVSLGYNSFDNAIFNHTYADLNGQTTLIARAVNKAFQKGMLIVVAAGNDGNDAWHYITTPGDASDALSVGAVDSNGHSASFSSYGPNSAGQVKPDVAAVGALATVVNQFTGAPTYGNGTSYACPIMAGISTCLWQAFPEFDNKMIVNALQQSGNNSMHPDDRTGYGIPDAKKAFVWLQKKTYQQQVTMDQHCVVQLSWNVKTAADMNIVVERKLATDSNYVPIDTQFVQTEFSQQYFSFSDDLTKFSTGLVQYRIKMTIASDTSFYLDSSQVNHATICYLFKDSITVAPNPVNSELKVFIKKPAASGQGEIILYNMLGQIVYRLSGQDLSTDRLFSIPVNHLEPGIYCISIWINNRKQYLKKIVKQ